MKGSVTKYSVRGSSRPRWRYRIHIGKDETGRKLYEGKEGFAKESEATEGMRDHIAEFEARQNAVPAPPQKTLGEWLYSHALPADDQRRGRRVGQDRRAGAVILRSG